MVELYWKPRTVGNFWFSYNVRYGHKPLSNHKVLVKLYSSQNVHVAIDFLLSSIYNNSLLNF